MNMKTLHQLLVCALATVVPALALAKPLAQGMSTYLCYSRDGQSGETKWATVVLQGEGGGEIVAGTISALHIPAGAIDASVELNATVHSGSCDHVNGCQLSGSEGIEAQFPMSGAPSITRRSHPAQTISFDWSECERFPTLQIAAATRIAKTALASK
jgi:hypothetical protein